jgi:hypothetical protein
MYYYSQRHIVGVDFKQPPQVKGLLTVNNKNTRTQIAQAMYRLRKLNRGHTIEVAWEGAASVSELTGIRVLDMVTETERHVVESRNTSLYLHYLKFLKRCTAPVEDDVYRETDLEPNYFVHDLDSEQLKALVRSRISNHVHGLLSSRIAPEDTKHLLALLQSDTQLPKTVSIMFGLDAEDVVDAIVNFSKDPRPLNVNNTFLWDWIEDGEGTTINTSSTGVDFETSLGTVFMSQNLFTLVNEFNGQHYNNFIIQVTETKYYIESSSYLYWYVCCGKPLYTLKGMLINNFTGLLHHSSLTPAKLDVDLLLNVDIASTSPLFPTLNVANFLGLETKTPAIAVNSSNDTNGLLLALMIQRLQLQLLQVNTHIIGVLHQLDTLYREKPEKINLYLQQARDIFIRKCHYMSPTAMHNGALVKMYYRYANKFCDNVIGPDSGVPPIIMTSDLGFLKSLPYDYRDIIKRNSESSGI